jgi:hypothetical protein
VWRDSDGFADHSGGTRPRPRWSWLLYNYKSSAYSFTAGIAAQTITPTNSGGAATSWSVSPALPAGLTLNLTNGSISGTATAAAASATYTVTASNAGGQSPTPLSLAVSAAPLLDLGHVSEVTIAKAAGTAALTEDNTGHWVLWNLSTGAIVAEGSAIPFPYEDSVAVAIDLAGSIMVVQSSSGLEIRDPATGNVIAEIAVSLPIGNNTYWWMIASDGSYVCAGTSSGLTAWSPTGSLLFSVSGDYSHAIAFAAPGQVQVANGAAGTHVVQTVAVPSGTAVLTPTFGGEFGGWFLDGGRFFTNDGAGTYVYSNSGVQQEQLAAHNFAGGVGNWVWGGDASGNLDLYAVGGGAQPVATYGFGANTATPVSYGTTVLLTNLGSPTNAMLLDLSGAAPVANNYTLPGNICICNFPVYAASPSSGWIIGTDTGLVLKALAAPSSFQALDYGEVTGIAGSSSNFVIATASGSMFYYNAADNSRLGTINAFTAGSNAGSDNSVPSIAWAPSIALSTDGTVLAALTQASGAATPSLSIYTLPGGGLENSFSNVNGFTLSGSGAYLAENVVGLNPPPCFAQENPITGGTPLWCDVTGTLDQVQLSPDGTLVAASPGFAMSTLTTIYSGGKSVASVNGWVVGWLSNDTFLVNTFSYSMGENTLSGSVIYNSSGELQSSLTLPQIQSIQVVSPTSIYSPAFNSIYSTASGAVTWTSGSAGSSSAVPLGAVAGSEVVFTSGNYVLAEPLN